MPRKRRRTKPKRPTESPCAYVKRKYNYLARMIANTKDAGVEHAYSICHTPEQEDFVMGECSGTSCSVVPVECGLGNRTSVSHTHPGPGKNHNAFSIADLASGVAKDALFDCIYSTPDKKGLCITYRPDANLYRDEIQKCRTIEKQYKKGAGEKAWKALEECYRTLPLLLGQSFCEYTLTGRAKKIKKYVWKEKKK